jgi:hypothetical protein
MVTVAFEEAPRSYAASGVISTTTVSFFSGSGSSIGVTVFVAVAEPDGIVTEVVIDV